MKRAFADTSYFFALLNPRDQFHQAAVALSASQSPALVTTDFILLELGNSMKLPSSRQTFVKFVEHLRASEQVQVVPLSVSLLQAGLDLFASRADKAWSLTDCTSFVVMQNEQLQQALTADHHFEQAGFQTLLK
ncbi:MAG: hypothetical protein KatS3mg111_3891 [Pirellulaceae bacterium]|nr:MAG: hypothetical protein KatS3mg111_3891 [Pirellulaceae bacterium]